MTNESEILDLKGLEGIGQTAALFSIYLPDIIERYPDLRILSADMSYIAKLERFKALYPEKFINVGISEQNMIGLCAGLTAEGFQCVALAQASFITMRCFEQVRQFMSYMGYPIILIGLAAGFQLQFMGNSHYSMEDISLIRSIPGITVYSPADAGEAVKAFQSALSEKKPAYIRLTGANDTPAIYLEDFRYDFRHAHILKEGKDVSLFATGSMVNVALEAVSYVENSIPVRIRVIDMHVLAPIDESVIRQSKDARMIVSLEEHHTTGGLGSAIADLIASETGFPPLLKLGINDRYSPVGDYHYLLEQNRLTAPQIAEDIVHFYNRHL